MIDKLTDIYVSTVSMFLNPNSNFYVLYLVAGLGAATVVAMRNASLAEALRQVFDPKVWGHRSAIADYVLTFLNNAIAIVGGTFGLIGAAAIANAGAGALASVFGPSPHWTAGLGATLAFTLATALAVDYGNYSRHLLQHRIPFLWELHKVHHAAEVLTPITTSRGHPIILILTIQYLAVFSGLVSAVFLYLYGGPVAEATIFGVNAVTLLFWSVLGGHLAHMNFWVMFPKPLSYIFYSPALHLIHHSKDPKHYDTNMGLIFSFWDRWGGTLYEPTQADRAGLEYGLGPADMEELRTVPQLLWTPIRNIGRMTVRALGGGRKSAIAAGE